jgi:hypothetical protein
MTVKIISMPMELLKRVLDEAMDNAVTAEVERAASLSEHQECKAEQARISTLLKVIMAGGICASGLTDAELHGKENDSV